jgi:hypothetical protein
MTLGGGHSYHQRTLPPGTQSLVVTVGIRCRIMGWSGLLSCR